MGLLKTLFGKKTRVQPQVEIIRRDVSRLTLNEWRSSVDLTRQAAKFINDPEFRVMLDTLRNSHPGMNVIDERLPSEARSVLLGRVEGYQMALNDLESLATMFTQQAMPEATFEPPENLDIQP